MTQRHLHLAVLLLCAASVAVASLGGGDPRGGGEGGELGLSELPSQPMVFNSPEELRTYLKELDKYFAIVGRPRFGRNLGNSYPKPMFPYFRANPQPPAF